MEHCNLALFSRIEQLIGEIESCVQEVRKKHTRILSSPFHDEAEHAELDKLMVKIQSSSSQTWTLLKAAKQNKLNGIPGSRASVRMETVQLNSLHQKFIDVLADYSNAQVSFRDRRKKLLKRQLEITGQEVNDEELERMLDENKAIFTQDYIVEVEKTRDDLTDVKKRCSQILTIENSLRDLHDMLLSLSILTNTQGEVIDSVEHHVLQASKDVEEGNKDIEKTVKKKKKIRKTKLAIISSLLVIGVIIVVLLIII